MQGKSQELLKQTSSDQPLETPEAPGLICFRKGVSAQ